MLKSRLIPVLLGVLLLAPMLLPDEPARAEPLACLSGYCYHLPMISQVPDPLYFPMVLNQITTPESPLIINHENIDISQIPDYWLAEARKLTVHYAHTSHGGQIFEGMSYLDSNTKYAFATTSTAFPSLPGGSNILKFYDGNSYATNYITPDMYWEYPDGISHTITTANSGLFNYSTWTWCGQAEYYSSNQINQYLAQMSTFEGVYPDMRFILMTGHNVAAPGTNLLAHNQMIRDYAIAHNMILFDFADIETYDPDGNFYNPATWNYSDGNCPWCATWCSTHSGYCDQALLNISCAHTHPLFCKMKAQAFWWMMARLAGWPGTP